MKYQILLFALCAPVLASGQSFQEAARSADRDLRDSLQRLATQREQIRDQKIPLARELARVEEEVRTKRREVERVQRLRDNKNLDLSNLESEVRLRRDEIDYLSNLLSEYARSFRVRLDLSEMQRFSETVQKLGLLEENQDLSKGEKLQAQAVVVDLSMRRSGDLLGGFRFPGNALGPDGISRSGTFVLLGPSTYFASADGSVAGLAVNTGSLEPTVSHMKPVQVESVAAVAREGVGPLPLDPTLGDARALAEVEETLFEHIQKGGIWMIPIIGFGLLSMLTALYKAIEIYTVKPPQPGTLHTILSLLSEGKKAEAAEFAKGIGGAFGAMLHDGVQHSDESKELVEEVLYERMLDVQPRLERLLPFIMVTAATAPLFGLLGTVTGMISTFRLITVFGTGDAKSLSSGISEALITTEFGLIVAIPSLILHSLLARRAQGVMASMERLAVAFVNGLPRKS